MPGQIIIIVSTLFLFTVKTNTHIEVKCPSGKHWYLRAMSFCSSVNQYTCLLDYVNNADIESCTGQKTEPPGDKTVINSGNFDTESCSFERFQPFSFSTSQGNTCIYKKTMCSEEGQLVYNNGTSVYNRKCACDYRNNFSFVSTKRIDMCFCDPTNEDCSCHIKLCDKGHILTPDYQCVRIENSYGEFVCKDIKIQSSHTNVEKRNETKITDTNELVGQNGKSIAEIWTVCLAGIIVIVVGFLFMFLILQKYEKIKLSNTADHNTNMTKTEKGKSKFSIHKATVESYNGRPYEFTVLKDLIEDGTIEIYDSSKNTTESNPPQIIEKKVLHNLFEEYKSKYIIRRREEVE